MAQRPQSVVARIIEELITHYVANELSERTNIPGTGPGHTVTHGGETVAAAGGHSTDILGLGKIAWAAVALIVLALVLCVACSGSAILIGLFLPWIVRFLAGFFGAG